MLSVMFATEKYSKPVFEIPDVGPIGLESDRGRTEYRRIRIKELC
jgi:hypothetical protein